MKGRNALFTRTKRTADSYQTRLQGLEALVVLDTAAHTLAPMHISTKAESACPRSRYNLQWTRVCFGYEGGNTKRCNYLYCDLPSVSRPLTGGVILPKIWGLYSSRTFGDDFIQLLLR